VKNNLPGFTNFWSFAKISCPKTRFTGSTPLARIYGKPLTEAAKLTQGKQSSFTIAVVFDFDKFIVVRNTFVRQEMKKDPKWENLFNTFQKKRTSKEGLLPGLQRRKE